MLVPSRLPENWPAFHTINGYPIPYLSLGVDYMRILAVLVVIPTLLFLAPSAGATETEIVGKSKAGQNFTFMYGFPADPSRLADFPLPPNVSSEPGSLSGVQATANRTANSPEINNESQCGMLSTKDALFIEPPRVSWRPFSLSTGR